MVDRNEFDFAGKKVVILGLARQGLALARFFVGQGATVVVSDAAPAEKLEAEIAALADLPVALVLGEHPPTLLDGCDLLCLSGGVPPQLAIVQQAIAQGIRLSNDSLLTFQLARQRGLGPLIAITGSSGKTTTTTLVGLMLEEAGLTVHVGGNIGTPLIDRLECVAPGEPIVLELSSFQLELFDPKLAWGELAAVGPDVAALLNITPNHLDRHAGMADYAAAKLNLLRTMPVGATLVLNADDPVTAALGAVSADDPLPGAASAPPAAWALDAVLAETQLAIRNLQLAVLFFSRQSPVAGGAWLDGETLVIRGAPIAGRGEVQLRGDHNISNVLAASAISGAAGAPVKPMHRVATRFRGVPLEVVAEVDGVLWINDSIATSPERAVAALRSFAPGAQTLILLAGGKDKNLPWDRFADEAIQRVNLLIGFGQAGDLIVNTVQERAKYTKRGGPNVALVQRLDEAVELAARVAYAASAQRAGARSVPDAVVLLSPGGTSYDSYRDFEARGEHYRQLVAKWAKWRVATIA
jgi:UDP-N-acetylmuramoylalanine--D-glutamate ligase